MGKGSHLMNKERNLQGRAACSAAGPLIHLFLLMLMGFFIAQLFTLLFLAPHALWEDKQSLLGRTLEDFSAIQLLVAQIGSSFFVFLLPAWWFLLRRKREPLQPLFVLPSATKIVALIIGMLCCFLIINNAIAAWNQRIPFPDILPSLKAWVEERQTAYDAVVERLVVSYTLWDFLLRVLAMALLPALGEELIFRHILQRELVRATGNVHAGIFCAALLFSIFHLHWMGFFPRVALGVLFGYLYAVSSSFLTAFVPHFLNNLFIVILGYLKGLGWLDIPLQAQNTVPPPIYLLFFALLVLFLLFRAYALHFRRTLSFSAVAPIQATEAPGLDWCIVHVDPQLHRVKILSDLLQQEGIRAVIVNKRDSAYPFGFYELHTARKDEKLAKEIVERIRQKE